ncbi:polyphosphate kinase 1 [Eionea flava]
MSKTPSDMTPKARVSDDTIDISQPQYYLNRELSHLAFNERVLAQSLDKSHPLLERLRFLLIFSANLDEFFEIRVAGIQQRLLLQSEVIDIDGLHPNEVLQTISERCHRMITQQYQTLNDALLPALAEEGILFLTRDMWTQKQREWVEEYVKHEVLPVISPIGLDPAHPFPRLVNKSLNFIVSLEGKDAFGRDTGLAIIPAPRSLPRLVQLPAELCNDQTCLVFLSSMIHANAHKLFPGMKVKGCYQFRITRNADLNVNEDSEDLARALRGELHSRRFGRAVRLEVADNCPEALVNFLLNEAGLSQDELYQVNGPVNLKRMMDVMEIVTRSDLTYPAMTPAIPKGLGTKDSIFETIAKKDHLLLHPYESFAPVIHFLQEAAKDPDVIAIKQTLYRSGNHSPIVSALIEAARNGKEVTAVIELRARFDEEDNLNLAASLQEAGALVVYGVVGYKTHAKMSLVVRRENAQFTRYVHLGTGNYHAGTARVYTDYSLLSADKQVAEDVHRIFHQLTGMGKSEKIIKVLNAPFNLKETILALIKQETQAALEGKKARLIFKANGLTEPKIIQALYKASQAGVSIDLIIRGMCCLRPGIKGVSDNIRVRSIVGRFLEHSRVYYFKHASPSFYCSSADLMERNLHRRIETGFPIEKSSMAKRMLQELEYYLDDTWQSWLLDSEGDYQQQRIDADSAVQQQLLNKLAQ